MIQSKKHEHVCTHIDRKFILSVKKEEKEKKKEQRVNSLSSRKIRMYNLGGSLSLRCMIREKEKDCERYRDKKTYLHERR